MQENNNLLELTGTVEDIIYRNSENGYTVLTLSGEDEYTAVGIMPMVNCGEQVRLLGNFKSHASYGEQFAVEVCERTTPTSAEAIFKYLSSGAIKGIGEATARRLVENFGDKTLEIMENSPKVLATIKGISLDKAMKISDELKSMLCIREIMAALGKYGIPPQNAVKLWNTWGNQTLKIIEENPYAMCYDGLPITFEIADAIAFSQHRPADDSCRVRAGLVHILEHNSYNGHTCLPSDRLISACCSFLNINKEQAESALKEMTAEESLISEAFDQRDFIFLPMFHKYETYAAARLIMLLRYPATKLPRINEEIAFIEKQDNLQYADLQRSAISEALSRGLLILTGGPGTGKTTTLNAIIKILKKNGQKVFLAAPTGRAAQRMSEVTGCESKTIHRLLEVSWDKQDRPFFNKNEKNMLNCDALIIDELSMIDSYLFDSVMRALPMGCRLILVGDCDQLPSVGAGNVLGDLIASQMLPVVQLTEIFRQSMESLIVTNAHSIVGGNMPNLEIKNNDFFFLNAVKPATISSTIVELVKNRLPNTYGYSPTADIQVLSPGKKGDLGTIALNRMLQNALNPEAPNKGEVTINGNTLRVGDKIMHIKNNYDILWVKDNGEHGEGVFNGDIGILTEVNKVSGSLKVRYDDKIATYSMESAIDLDLAYACTVHKSQGNEFNAVIIPMYNSAPQLLYRNLLYTAVTRAKKLLILVGNKTIVQRMVNNNKRTLRYSGLKNFLTKE